LGHYSPDFKVRKDLSFSLEGLKDSTTGLSEVDMLEELARYQQLTRSQVIRAAVVDYVKKNNCKMTKIVRLDEFTDKNSVTSIEPTLAEYYNIHENFISNSDLSINESKRRAAVCKRLVKLYEDRAFKLNDDEWRREHQKKITSKVVGG
jgi:hypothetical protein